MEVLEVAENKKASYTLIKCENCGKEFECQNFRIQKHKHLFCTKRCEAEFRKSQAELNCICDYCGRLFHRKPSGIHSYWNTCSKECSKEIRKIKMKGELNHQYNLKGELNASWKSDERISHYGYKLIRCLDHPFKNSDDFVFEHRLVAERYLLTEGCTVIIDGKAYLSPDFIVHHCDFNKLNNTPDNLRIMPLNTHTKYHTLINKRNLLSDQQNKELIEIEQKYNLPLHFTTEDDNTDGVRNRGFGSTNAKSSEK